MARDFSKIRTQFPRIGRWLFVASLLLVPSAALADCGQWPHPSSRANGDFELLVKHQAIEGIPNHPAPSPRCTGAFCRDTTSSPLGILSTDTFRPDPISDTREFALVAVVGCLSESVEKDLLPIGRMTALDRPPRIF